MLQLLKVARFEMASAGTSTAAIIMGGDSPPSVNTTEEWAFAASIETVAFD